MPLRRRLEGLLTAHAHTQLVLGGITYCTRTRGHRSYLGYILNTFRKPPSGLSDLCVCKSLYPTSIAVSDDLGGVCDYSHPRRGLTTIFDNKRDQRSL